MSGSAMPREMGVGGELVPRGVLAGGLILEVTERARAAAAGDPHHVGEVHRRLSALVIGFAAGQVASSVGGEECPVVAALRAAFRAACATGVESCRDRVGSQIAGTVPGTQGGRGGR
jgi:hypothetical protein